MDEYGAASEQAHVLATGEDSGPFLYIDGEVVDIEDTRAAAEMLDRIMRKEQNERVPE